LIGGRCAEAGPVGVAELGPCSALLEVGLGHRRRRHEAGVDRRRGVDRGVDGEDAVAGRVDQGERGVELGRVGRRRVELGRVGRRRVDPLAAVVAAARRRDQSDRHQPRRAHA
jgi:hypothetical protein